MSQWRVWLMRFSMLAAGLRLATAEPAGATQKADPGPGTETNRHFKPFPKGRFILERDDVVAFLGGADVAAAQHTGHLETLLAVNYRDRKVHFRNFGWEGDTVYAQPREVGFPPLPWHLQRVGASVIVLQFGRSEALAGRTALPGFLAAYQKVLAVCTEQTPRLVLVTPPPFEPGGALLPDLTGHNGDLAVFADAIRQLAHQRRLPLVDLFAALGGVAHRDQHFTVDGLQLSARGQAIVAGTFAAQLGLTRTAHRAGEPEADGHWPNAAFECVRQAVVAKNRLWFDYWRPQNWAFLGGDRTSQPSSRDHRDPSIRWFPIEQEQFVPLIQRAEERVTAAIEKIARK